MMNNTLLEDIQDICKQIIQTVGLTNNSIKLKKLKNNSISVCLYEEDFPLNTEETLQDAYNGETKLFTIKKEKAGVSIITSLTSLEKVQIPTTGKDTTTPGMKKDGVQGKITFSIPSNMDTLFSLNNSHDDFLKFIKALVYHFLSCYVSKNYDFVCCDSYNDCVKCQKCLHPNKLRGMGGCLYFRYHLQKDIINNLNRERKEHNG